MSRGSPHPGSVHDGPSIELVDSLGHLGPLSEISSQKRLGIGLIGRLVETVVPEGVLAGADR